MTNNLFFKISLFLFVFLAGSANAFSEETICRLSMCGENFSRTTLPNLFKTRGETLRVYVKFGDLVQVAECDASGVTLSIGQKRGLTADPCDTYVDITVLPGSNAPERNDVTITLFGRDLVGNRTKTCAFKINIRYAFPSISSISIKKNGATLPNNEVIAGVTYQMTVNGTNVDRLNFSDYKSQNQMLSLVQRPNATASAIIYDVRFFVSGNGRVSDITYWYADRICGLGVTTFHLANRLNILEGVELVDDGLQGKYAEGFFNCAGYANITAESNRRTLARVREQIDFGAANRLYANEITWPDIKWGVKNMGRSTTTPFTIELRDGTTVLQRQTINGMAKGENTLFFLTRPKSLKKLGRAFPPYCSEYIFVHRDCQTVEAYKWSDPAKFTIVIDVANTVEEVNEDNNTGEY